MRKPNNIDKSKNHFSIGKTINKIEGDEVTGLATCRFNQEYSRYMLVKMIIMDEKPFSLVEREGFRDYIDLLQSLWQNISRFSVAKDYMKGFIMRN